MTQQPKPMMPLKKLTSLFAQSAATEELSLPVRRFAAQMTILTAHVERTQAAVKVLDGHIAEIAAILQAQVASKSPAPSASTPAAEQPVQMSAAEGDEEDGAEDMAEQVLADTEAEMARINSGLPEEPIEAPAPVVPVAAMTVRKNGGKQKNAGGAA